MTSDAERFWSKVDRSAGPDACWTWTGALHTPEFPYGRFRAITSNEPGVGKTVYAHRFAYEISVGPIPEGMFICHHCDNPPCCNPAHLFVGTPEDNSKDMSSKGRSYWTQRTSCIAGHPWDSYNTLWQKAGTARKCRECQRLRSIEYRKKAKSA